MWILTDLSHETDVGTYTRVPPGFCDLVLRCQFCPIIATFLQLWLIVRRRTPPSVFSAITQPSICSLVSQLMRLSHEVTINLSPQGFRSTNSFLISDDARKKRNNQVTVSCQSVSADFLVGVCLCIISPSHPSLCKTDTCVSQNVKLLLSGRKSHYGEF